MSRRGLLALVPGALLSRKLLQSTTLTGHASLAAPPDSPETFTFIRTGARLGRMPSLMARRDYRITDTYVAGSHRKAEFVIMRNDEPMMGDNICKGDRISVYVSSVEQEFPEPLTFSLLLA